MSRNKNNKRPSKDKTKQSSKSQLADKVSGFLKNNPGKEFSIKQIARKIHLNGKKRFEFTEFAIDQLMDQKIIEEVKPGMFRASLDASEGIEGKVEFVNPRFAFIVSEESEKDIKVNANNLNNALDGDRVKVVIHQGARRGMNPEGEVVEVLERKRTEYVGIVDRKGNNAFLIADSRRMHMDIFIVEDQGKKAFNGDKVIVKITKWPQNGRKPEGEVIRVLGEAGTHEVEINAIMAEYDLPMDFPESVEHDAEKISDVITDEEIAKRRDMRDVTTFTIDPHDAKDFDDALSIRPIQDGVWEIGIHIADVTHYVKEETRLEEEAYERATSVYLVDRVIPMLPERLSNGLCSLRPNEDKLTFSAIFEINEAGGVLKEWFGRTIIHSDHRFAYEDAQELLDGAEGPFKDEVLTLNRIAYKLREDRFANGSIAFETAEVKFRLDEDGTPLEVIPKVRQDAHKLIEDFMLLANKKVAEFVFKKVKGDPLTFVYRMHGNPNMEKLESFANFAQRFGHTVVLDPTRISHVLNDLSKETAGKPEENILQSLAIRSMAKAIYTTEPEGHFGLGFEHYTHFTSPIRRYPDMMVHRLLQRYLDKGKSADQEMYEGMCEHSSEMEKRAADAERASIKYKQVEFMSMQEDEAFEGIVTGVTDFGIFIEIISTKCEGMVRLANLDDDYYDYDPDELRIIGRNNQRMITFGDKLTVKVIGTDLLQRTIDLELVD